MMDGDGHSVLPGERIECRCGNDAARLVSEIDLERRGIYCQTVMKTGIFRRSGRS